MKRRPFFDTCWVCDCYLYIRVHVRLSLSLYVLYTARYILYVWWSLYIYYIDRDYIPAVFLQHCVAGIGECGSGWFTWCSRMELEIHPWSCACCWSPCHTYYFGCCGSGNVRASDWSSSTWSSGVSTCCALPCSGSRRRGSPGTPIINQRTSRLIITGGERFFQLPIRFHGASSSQ